MEDTVLEQVVENAPATREVRVADEGLEDYFEFLTGKIENLELEKQTEKDAASAEIDARYEKKLLVFTEALEKISHIEVVAEEHLADAGTEETAE